MKVTVNNFKIIFLTESVIFSILDCLIYTNVAAGVLNFLLSILIIITINNERIYKYFILITICFQVMMFLTYFGWIKQTGLPYLIGSSDDRRFEEIADIYIREGWYNFTENHGYSTNTRFYIFVIMLLKRFGEFFGGYSPVLPRLLNGYVLLMCVSCCDVLMEKYWGFNVNEIEFVDRLLSLHFYMLYICSYTFRDPFCLLIVLLIIVNVKKMLTGNVVIKKLWLAIKVGILIFVGYYLRSQLLIIGLALVIIGLLFYDAKKNYKTAIVLLLIAIATIFIDSVYGVIGLLRSNEVYTYLQTQSAGISHTIIGLPLFPFGIIARIVYALIYPFPAYMNLFHNWNAVMIDLAMLLSYIYGFYQFIHLPKLIKAFKLIHLEIITYFMLFLVLFTVATFTFRHYLLVIPFLTMLIGIGICRYKTDQDTINSVCMTILYVLMNVAYIIIS